MTERCSLWSALSAAACCFYRGSFMQVQVSDQLQGGARGNPHTTQVSFRHIGLRVFIGGLLTAGSSSQSFWMISYPVHAVEPDRTG